MEDYRPIETVYNGYRFRSRLEARWAVFFDALGIRYEYEKEGYELSDPRNGKVFQYLPDFYLPEENVFVEIKGTVPTDDERNKAGLLAYCTEKLTGIVAGNIGEETILGFNPRKKISDTQIKALRGLRDAGGFNMYPLLNATWLCIPGELYYELIPGTRAVPLQSCCNPYNERQFEGLVFHDQKGIGVLSKSIYENVRYQQTEHRIYEVPSGPVEVSWFSSFFKDRSHKDYSNENAFSPLLQPIEEAYAKARGARFEFGEKG